MEVELGIPQAISPVQAALHTPELISEIMRFTNKSCLPAAARVCCTWYPNVLDEIWRECCLIDLLQTFCAMEYDEKTSAWEFNGVGKRQWDRFLDHARRVVHLRHDDTRLHGEKHISTLASTALIVVETNFKIGPDAIYLPNIRSIHWHCTSPASAAQLVPFVARATSLQKVDIRFGATYTHLPAVLEWALLTLGNLLPAGMISIRLDFSGLHPQVTSFHDFLDKLKCGMKLQYLGFQQELEKHSEEMGTSIAEEILAALTKFSALQTLEFECSHDIGLERPVSTMLNLPMLREVRLAITVNVASTDINFLRPLLELHNLTALSILHDCPVRMDEADITSMRGAWPLLETLHFPSVITDTHQTHGIPLRWLVLFATELPSLRALSLHFYGYVGILTADDVLPRFPHLRKLAVGNSGEGDLHQIAEFLGEVCAPGVEIQSSSWEAAGALLSAFGRDSEKSLSFWDDVGTQVKRSHRIQAAALRRAAAS